MAKILVIDDEADFRDGLIETLADLSQHAIGVGRVRDALALLEREKFDAIFIDFRMPDIDGIEAIRLIQEQMKNRPLPIVMITAFVDSENTIAAMKLGAFDHLTKPVSRKDIERVLSEILGAFPELKAQPKSQVAAPSGTLIGSSPALRDVLKMIGRLAANDSSVLIIGETGTGKELVAKAIHANSARARFPFIAVNCAAIPENLLESELFGHVKGAFTGAASDRKGSFQSAEGGTLLLDEIGDMEIALQAKLLRTLQEREVTPVGSSKPVKINVRFVAATHQNLKAMVAKKEFREDLYYRLNVVEIHLPALRERANDVIGLAEHFLGSASEQKILSSGALEKLQTHSWPGNIRELKNVIERATVISRGSTIGPDDVKFLTSSETPVEASSLDLPSAVAHLERDLIARALKAASGNRSEAARKLGIQRQLLYTKMRDYQIEPLS